MNTNHEFKTSSTFGKVLFTAIKNGRFKEWFYAFKNGHPFLLKEEANIICETRLDETYEWMNDEEIQELVKLKVKAMYKKKFPNAKRWSAALI